MASASISTRIAGSTSPATATVVLAGHIAPTTSPCARPTGPHGVSLGTLGLATAQPDGAGASAAPAK